MCDFITNIVKDGLIMSKWEKFYTWILGKFGGVIAMAIVFGAISGLWSFAKYLASKNVF